MSVFGCDISGQWSVCKNWFVNRPLFTLCFSIFLPPSLRSYPIIPSAVLRINWTSYWHLITILFSSWSCLVMRFKHGFSVATSNHPAPPPPTHTHTPRIIVLSAFHTCKFDLSSVCVLFVISIWFRYERMIWKRRINNLPAAVDWALWMDLFFSEKLVQNIIDTHEP